MFISNRVKPMVNVIIVGNSQAELNSHSSPKDNRSETHQKIAFWNMHIYKKIRPLIISLKICGLFSTHENCSSFSSVFWRCHFFFIFSLVLFNLLRSISTFDPKDGLGPKFFMKMQWTIWSLENFTRIVIFRVGFRRKCRFPLLFLKQDKLFGQYEHCFGNLNQIIVSLIVPIILVPLLNVAFHIVCGRVSPTLSELQFSSRWPEFLKNSLPFWLMNLLDSQIVFVNSAICTCVICFFCFMCYLIVIHLKNMRISIEKATSNGFITEELANYRNRFQELCDVITTLDGSFRYIIFMTLLTGIPLFCVLFYQVICFSKTVDESVFFSILLVMLIIYMSIFLLLSASINTETRNLLPVLYKIRVNDDLKKQELEMLMFLSQLTGPDIGLSACNIIIITRRTLLTVAGLLLTYFLLLVQYGDSYSAKTNLTKINQTSN